MSVDSETYDAFASHLHDFASQLSPPLSVAYPGLHFEPPNEGMWLQMRWFPGATENYGTANDGPSLHQGIGQVTACARDGNGATDVIALADSVIEHFAKGTILGPSSVYTKPWQSSVLVGEGKAIVPVTVRYRAFVNG